MIINFDFMGMLILSTLAIISSWIIYIADLVVNIERMNKDSFWKPLSILNSKKIVFVVYSFMLFPFQLFPLILLYKGFSPLGNVIATVPTGLLGFLFTTVCVALHVSYYYYSVVGKQVSEVEVEQKQLLLSLIDKFDKFKDKIGTLFFALFCSAYLMIFVIIITGKTIYPYCFAILNPVLGIIITRLLKKVIPSFKLKLLPAFWQALMITVVCIYHLFIF